MDLSLTQWFRSLTSDHKPNTTDLGLCPYALIRCFWVPDTYAWGRGFTRQLLITVPPLIKSGSHNIAEKMMIMMKTYSPIHNRKYIFSKEKVLILSLKNVVIVGYLWFTFVDRHVLFCILNSNTCLRQAWFFLIIDILNI